jgi:short-subunit dehydrogenase
MKTENRYTVITGASQGLGKSLATECAKRGRDLILISLPNENINELTNVLTDKYGIHAIGYETDLTEDSNITELSEWITNNYHIDMLVNNAGTGGTKRFSDATESYIDNIIFLNIRALVMLTRNLLPLLKEQKKAYILNIASLASFGPMPFKTVYPASKAFVYSFSRGLNAELKDCNITVSVAHPGGMATNPDVSERIEKYNSFVKATILSPEEVANICIKKILKGKSLIIPGVSGKLSWMFFRYFPAQLRLNIFRKTLLKEIKPQKQIDYA